VIRSKLFLCSDSASIDARNNTLSVFHILEQLNAIGFPVVVPRLSVVAIFEREQTDPATIQLQLEIYAGLQQLFAGPIAVNFFQQLMARTVLELNGLVVPAPGNLRVVVTLEGQAVGSWTIPVIELGQPHAQIVFPPTAPQAPTQ
jgi:hypothetical protein